MHASIATAALVAASLLAAPPGVHDTHATAKALAEPTQSPGATSPSTRAMSPSTGAMSPSSGASPTTGATSPSVAAHAADAMNGSARSANASASSASEEKRVACTGSLDARDDLAPSSLRVERFVLAEAGASPDRASGCVEWRRLAHADGFQVECEILFERSGRDLACQRVLHVEELCDSTARLVWREMGAGSGRSLTAEWEPEGSALRTVEWDRNDTVRETIDARDGAVMPLYLIEMLRHGRVTSGRYPVFDPLSRSLAEVEVLTSYGDEHAELPSAGVHAGNLRSVELLRADGSLFGRYCFRGADLVAFQWQEGGPWARRVNATEFDAARAALCSSEPRTP